MMSTLLLSKKTKLAIKSINRLFILSLNFLFLVKACKSFNIQSKTWTYKGHCIAYEEASRLYDSESSNDRFSSPKDYAHDPVLLLNGFGVGSFHQHRLMPNLLSVQESFEEKLSEGFSEAIGNNRVIYGVDYLGQGKSWPIDCNDGNSDNEKGLIYSIDTWADQIIQFIEEIILPNHQKQSGNSIKVHLVGNSVGGHLSVVLAAKRPDLIHSICLLNATPVWGLNLPGWSGHLPPPFIPRKIGRYLFDRIRDLNTIERYLENAYSNRSAFEDELIKQIRDCTEGNGGHAAFASILWSPPATFSKHGDNSFYANLSKLECDVLLIFGKKDPWCTPSFAKRMLSSLKEREKDNNKVGLVQRYIELDNVGHCPNHEAPQAVGIIVKRWIESTVRRNGSLSLIDGNIELVPEPWGDISMREVPDEEAKLSLVEKLFTSMV